MMYGVSSEWWGAGVVVCLERGADLDMAQLMPLPLTVSCFSKIHIGFTFLVPAYPGSVLFFSRPRSEGWPHHGRTFSIYPSPVSF